MKSLAVVFTLLLSAILLAEQDTSNPQPGSNPGDTATSPQTIQGCLKGDGNTFTLIDDSGTTYQVEGDSAKLKKHVGHEVQITGSTSASSAASSTSSMPQGWFTVADAHCGQGETYILKAARPRASE